MFHWNAAIYFDDKVKKKPERYRRILEKKKIVKSCYCITLPENEVNCLDVYSSREFWFDYNRRRKLEVVGLAASREGAEELVSQIAKDVLQQYGELDARYVREYFRAGQCNGKEE